MKKILITMIAVCAAFVSVHAQDSQWHGDAACDSLYHYTCDCGCHDHPVNSYSGLNSLREKACQPQLGREPGTFCCLGPVP